MKNKLKIPLNSDMAKLPLFRPAQAQFTRKCGQSLPGRMNYGDSALPKVNPVDDAA
ncbi:hypothetical protein [Aminobacter sp. AP02]|uniref:hypothetical protein n=1 Tax=Aminobacter sp. AP02 TaxID=2135737 RepID=UPI0018EE5B63|nr:hypothetical protein [Aminobacter sp. AP02]